MARAGIGLVLCLELALAAAVQAQEPVTLAADVLLFGDNTEFRNPFREGETLFGTAPRLSLVFALNDKTSLSLGVSANIRFGSDRATDDAWPVVALEVRNGQSAFLFGTLDPPRVIDPPGPDRAGPHGLLPPLQRESLAFERPHEAGLQWRLRSPHVRHDLWISWQQLNTPEHRERFNLGLNASWIPAAGITIPVQFHIVHHGGQQFASGPVSDSNAGAIGVAVDWPSNRTTSRLELLGLLSRHVPDREVPERSRTGRAVFARASIERSGWRGHVLFWRGKDFLKEEGDPNYLSIRRDGTYYSGVRDYAETGVARHWTPAPQVRIELSARLHRIERHYEYSFRIVSVVTLR